MTATPAEADAWAAALHAACDWGYDMTKVEVKSDRQAEPLLEDRSQFCRMADPALQGRYPSLDLQKAVTIASFCIQEKSDMRAPISTVVKVLCRLAHDVDRPESSHHAAPN
ncbi:hypothetical protein ZWY2020_049136 [Hordeum vulgare]|nr:hypothetical protein ZWY2020_019741 [Hordeum vulgare]KAI4975529.1 hypothetical protein ZWY2020_049136 [Hordeum vulgare]